MVKKQCFFILLLFTACATTFGQQTADIGFFFGRGYYLGELNPRTHWGNNVGSTAFGGVFRYNLNKRYSLKGTLIQTKLSGNDNFETFQFNQLRQASFENTITEFSGVIEFNFLPYKLGDKKHFFSPYLFVGISYFNNDIEVEILGFNPVPTNTEGGRKFALPFGPGIKLSLGRKWEFSAEWGFRKTSFDQIDGLDNRVNDVFETGKSYDNDWFVLSGFMLTYKLTNEGPCPVYNF